VETPPAGFSRPTLVWTGSIEDAVPACPASTPNIAYKGFADGFYGAPAVCPPCVCDPPPATCNPSSTMQARQALFCQGPSVSVSPGAQPWNGACSAQNALNADALCGSFPCVSSVEVAPPEVQAGGSDCTPHASAPPDIPPIVADRVVACEGDAPIDCTTDGFICAPTPPAGFQTCIHAPIDVAGKCPYSFPIQLIATEQIGDGRACSECNCGKLQGASCTVEVSLYGDSTCSTTPIGTAEVKTGEYGCINVDTGAAVVGKKAKVTSVDPGHCIASGGLPEGSLYNATLKEVFCCRMPGPI
jgi:hypothetical protein